MATSPEAPFAVAAFPNGAFVTMRSFLALVVGPTIHQDPALLAGLPEYVNWDANWLPWLPRSAASVHGELPKGAFVTSYAGNLRGVGGQFVWNGKRWVSGAKPRDPRIAARSADPRADRIFHALAWPPPRDPAAERSRRVPVVSATPLPAFRR